MSAVRLAATVVVLRPTATVPELLLVRRARQASFMADAFVFPGGRVDPSDGEGDAAFANAAARELLEEASVRVEASALVPFARWITPSAEPKRFDAMFFMATVPADTQARVDEAEVTELVWASAIDVLARHDRGELVLPPSPTLHTLTELTPLSSIDQALAWARAQSLEPIMPKLVVDEEPVILLPWDPAYDTAPGEGLPATRRGTVDRYTRRSRRFIGS